MGWLAEWHSSVSLSFSIDPGLLGESSRFSSIFRCGTEDPPHSTFCSEYDKKRVPGLDTFQNKSALLELREKESKY